MAQLLDQTSPLKWLTETYHRQFNFDEPEYTEKRAKNNRTAKLFPMLSNSPKLNKLTLYSIVVKQMFFKIQFERFKRKRKQATFLFSFLYYFSFLLTVYVQTLKRTISKLVPFVWISNCFRLRYIRRHKLPFLDFATSLCLRSKCNFCTAGE